MYPAAVRIGMSKKEFLRSTITDLKIRCREYRNAKKEEYTAQAELIEYQTWLAGLYVKIAVSSALSSKTKYPDKPLKLSGKSVATESDAPDVPKKSEDELKQEERYYELLIKKANANIAKVGMEKGRQDE